MLSVLGELVKSDNIRTLADTIIWLAEAKQSSKERCQNLNSAIHSVVLDIQQLLMEFMGEHRGD